MSGTGPSGGLPYGRALKAAREQAGLKQQELAERIGVSAAYISQLESGAPLPSQNPRRPSAELHELLVETLGEPLTSRIDPSEVKPRRSSTQPRVRQAAPARAVPRAVPSAVPPAVPPAVPTAVPASVVRAWETLLKRLGRSPAEDLVAQLTQLAQQEGAPDVFAFITQADAAVRELATEDLLDQARALRELSNLAATQGVAFDEVQSAIRTLTGWGEALRAGSAELARLIWDTVGQDPEDGEDELQNVVSMARSLVTSDPPSKAVVQVGFLETGRVGHVWLKAVGLDEDGLWINPRAPLIRGSDRLDPRVYRDEEGRLWVDTASLEAGRIPERTTGHTVQVVHAYALPGEAKALGDYERSVLVIQDPTNPDQHFTVRRADRLAESEAFPPGVDTVFVLTAANPDGRLLTARQNQARHSDLLQRVDELVSTPAVPASSYPERWFPQDGGAAPSDESQPGPPIEAGLALIDVDEAQVLTLAREFGQSSVFRWRRDGRAVITLDGSVVEHPWSSQLSRSPDDSELTPRAES